MSDTTETTTEIKKLHDLNLQALSDDFAALLTKHVGGKFKVTPIEMRHTHFNYGDDRVIFQFSVNDDSHIQRILAFREKGGFFAEPDVENNGQ